ncbi:MAG: hypothetical protein R3D01_11120 [Hyphomicrobiales bacterium]
MGLGSPTRRSPKGPAVGRPQEGPYDVIVLEGSVPEVPEQLLAQLAKTAVGWSR